MTKQRRLGRGLEALLARPLEEGAAAETGDASDAPAPAVQAHTEPLTTGGIHWLAVYDIDRNPYQPRKKFDEDELRQLADSIAVHGMMQPAVVRKAGERYQLISGERRWRAATLAGWDKLPCQIKEADDREMAELAIVENVQRKDLNPVEKAASFRRYLDQYGCTQEDLAERVNIDRSTVANLIRLLELPELVQQAVANGELSQGHARTLLTLGDEREQVDFCRKIQSQGLSVRETEELVRLSIAAADAEPLEMPPDDMLPPGIDRTGSEHLASLEQMLRAGLGTRVEIRQTGAARGKIIIHFTSNNEFERIKSHLTGATEMPRAQAG